jgi:hypothetical protein
MSILHTHLPMRSSPAYGAARRRFQLAEVKLPVVVLCTVAIEGKVEGGCSHAGQARAA